MLRWLYIQLLWAHPAQFRYRFCDEMLEIFTLSRGFAERIGLLSDGLGSLLRQWMLRSEFRQPAQPAGVPAYELITFQQIEPYKPRRIALAQGGLMALLLLLGTINVINHGGGKIRAFTIGMHRPGNGLIKVQRVEGEPLNTTVETGPGWDDPWRLFAISYFRIIRPLPAIDSNGDRILSLEELLNAPIALRLLDLNHNGVLSAEECGYLPGTASADGDRFAFMRENPVLAALDTDHNGEISEAEIANSPVSLKALDFDHDNRLMPAETLPHPATSQAAAMITKLDTNDDGLIGLHEPSKEDAPSVLPLLTAADRNHDGIVTRGELIVELAVRREGPQDLMIPKTAK